MKDTIEHVRNYLFENFLFDAEESALGNDDSFLEKGFIDSTGVLELVNWIEEKYGIKIDDNELTPENLDSVNLIASFIKGKQTLQADPARL